MADCVFCLIGARKIKADIVYEDKHVLAFRDIEPQAPVHILIVPRKHVASLNELDEDDKGLLLNINQAVKYISENEEFKAKSYRLVVNKGADAGQAVEHLHFHLLAGRKFSWPPG